MVVPALMASAPTSAGAVTVIDAPGAGAVAVQGPTLLWTTYSAEGVQLRSREGDAPPTTIGRYESRGISAATPLLSQSHAAAIVSDRRTLVLAGRRGGPLVRRASIPGGINGYAIDGPRVALLENAGERRSLVSVIDSDTGARTRVSFPLQGAGGAALRNGRLATAGLRRTRNDEDFRVMVRDLGTGAIVTDAVLDGIPGLVGLAIDDAGTVFTFTGEGLVRIPLGARREQAVARFPGDSDSGEPVELAGGRLLATTRLVDTTTGASTPGATREGPTRVSLGSAWDGTRIAEVIARCETTTVIARLPGEALPPELAAPRVCAPYFFTPEGADDPAQGTLECPEVLVACRTLRSICTGTVRMTTRLGGRRVVIARGRYRARRSEPFDLVRLRPTATGRRLARRGAERSVRLEGTQRDGPAPLRAAGRIDSRA